MEYQWITLGDGREVYRKVSPRQRGPRSDLASPHIVRDFDEPVQSCADGKWYSSKAALSRSHRAAHNPHGQDFIELGNEEMPWVEYKPDEKLRRQHVKEAFEDVKAGRLPEVLTLED